METGRMYCETCMLATDELVCPMCGNEDLRPVEPCDPCFLTEQSQIWAGVLEDVLKQNGIPFFTKGRMGAGMALKVGPMFEDVRFYVARERLAEAMDLVEELFTEADEPAGEICEDDGKGEA